MTGFTAGIDLCGSFFTEAVKPIVERTVPGLEYAAALLGSGSEVLGFDTIMSTDHDWGPRIDLFVSDADVDAHRQAIDTVLRNQLPAEYRGYATSFTEPDPNDNGTQLPERRPDGPIRHKIRILSPAGFFRDYLRYELAQSIDVADWLTFPEQKLRTISRGPIYQDGIGLERIRSQFRYYPNDVWLYQLVSAWERIGEEEHLMGRAGVVGDEIGSRLIAARLVRDVMRLCFLTERTYAPYPKWFGTAFQQLRCAATLTPHLAAALAAGTWRDRETHLVRAYEILAAMHNALGITEPLPTTSRQFFGRPFQVIALHGFAEAIVRRIEDPVVRRLAARPRIGSVDLFSDSTAFVSNPEWRSVARRLYSTDDA